MDTSEEYQKMRLCKELDGVTPETEKIYLAGLFDGEGTVSIRRATKKNMSHKLEIYITNTNIHVLKWVQAGFGGKIYVYDVKDGIRQPQDKWHAHTQGAYKILKTIYPYLIVKKAHAKLGIEFVEKLDRDASWHKNYVNRLKKIQGKEIRMEYPVHTIGQDQIQEMMPKCSCLTWEERTYCLSKRFWEFTEGHQQEEEYLTMEQLWLAFYMLEKHSKFWNGDKWIKSETE